MIELFFGINFHAQKATRVHTRGTFLTISNSYIAGQEPKINRWFKKYYTESKGSDNSSIGLGLFLVKRIMAAHEGDIDCVVNQEQECWRVIMNIWLPDKQVSENND